ncbi:WD40-repeat-containing domain protein [Suillus clintonianus]|uniref:WD40-repeat-containing domain protein n=1 Tax=Suillus clintonianus TaxID=1904413 RepID=UPI001B85EBD9|nr:WD40-repeat-containing domain protein [Suillus clintonianus]KAG2151527.1 WD40-repeat-containing domain protein [Suillus clintonianus]
MSRALQVDGALDTYFSILRRQPTPPRRTQGHTESVWASAFFKDNRQVVTGSWDCTLRIWDVEKRTLQGAISCRISRWIASGGDKTIIWDVKSRQMVFELLKHTQEVNSDVETGAVLAIFPHDGPVWCVAFSSDGLKLASGSSGRSIQIWLINIAQCFLKFYAHNRIRSLVWSPDAQQLISAADDKTVRFWNSSNGAQIDQPCTGHTNSIYLLAISSDGSFIATASDDKTVRIWSTETHQQIGRPLEHPDPVYCVAISWDGGLLVSGDIQGKVWFRSTKDVLKRGTAEERIETDEEAQRLWQRSISCTDTQLCSHNDINNAKLAGDHSSSSKHPSEIDEASGSDDRFSLSEVQRSVNSMFIWYRQSALTIVYLSDVPPSAKSGALANSVWNTRGWTVQEFLAPCVILFYQNDLNNHSLNHKDSITIMQELEDSTGINAQALVAFRPGMTGAREKLQWASTRVTTLQEDIAYSLFGIFRVHLPVIYGETKQNALGRLIQEIIARSGDITALDWVGKSSEFNSCLPANISSYKTIPYTSPLREDEMQMSVSRLQNTVTVESASNLYTLLYNVNAPRFANSRLQLPCIVFPVTAVKRRHSQEQETCFTYDVKADGLQDLLITTQDKLTQFSRTIAARQLLLLIRPWNRHDLELPDLEDDVQSVDNWSEPESPSSDTLSGYPGEDEPVDSESHPRALRLIARLGQPFSAFLLAQQRGGEYKRIASDHSVIAQVKDLASVDDMMDIRTLEIL